MIARSPRSITLADGGCDQVVELLRRKSLETSGGVVSAEGSGSETHPGSTATTLGHRLQNDRTGGKKGDYEKSMVRLFHAPSLKEASVGSVLFYVRRVTLLCRILDIAVTFGSILVDLGVIASSFVATIGGRHGRHFIVA